MAYMESKIISYHFCSKREVVITSFGQQTISCLLLDKRMHLILAKNRLKITPLLLCTDTRAERAKFFERGFAHLVNMRDKPMTPTWVKEKQRMRK